MSPAAYSFPITLFFFFLTTDARPWTLCHFPVSTCGPVLLNEVDRKILLDFKDKVWARDLQFGLDWNVSLTCANGWSGICTDRNGRVTEFVLTNYHLNGPIPDSFGGLEELVYLDIRNNFRLGFPPAISSFPNLVYLDVSNNGIFGLPNDITKLRKLRTLYLSSSVLDTSGPDTGVHVIKLINQMNLTHLDLSGSLYFGLLSNVTLSSRYKYLGLGSCNFSTLPPTIKAMKNLTHLDLGNNKMSDISGIQSLSKLTHLNLYSNKLKYLSSQTLSKMKNLQFLDLSYNSLTSLPPTFLDPLTNLRHLNLASNNGLQWKPIPSLRSLKALEYLDLSSNGFVGNFPSVLATFKNLTTIFLNKNKLCGQIPPTLGNLPITLFQLSSNYLTGPIPSNIIKRNLCYALDENCLLPSGGCIPRSSPTKYCTIRCSPVSDVSKDLALDGRASLSSTYGANKAALAIDGYAGFGNISSQSCVQTLNQTNPSLRIKLHFKFVITKVQLYNRLDYFPERLNGVKVFVGSSAVAYNAPGNSACSDPKFKYGPKSLGFPLNVTCNKRGRYVWAVLLGKGKVLTICEAAVFGYKG